MIAILSIWNLKNPLFNQLLQLGRKNQMFKNCLLFTDLLVLQSVRFLSSLTKRFHRNQLARQIQFEQNKTKMWTPKTKNSSLLTTMKTL